MTERTEDILSDGMPIIPEVVDDSSETPMIPEETTQVGDTIAFINTTISVKALEAALLIGDHILKNYFNDDIDAALSQNSYKPISFNSLCEHPDLRVSRNKLISMVKVAAQERFFMSMDINIAGLSYTHRLKLTWLPNDENKINITRECINRNLTVKQLDYRVRANIPESGSTPEELSEAEFAEKTINTLFAAMDTLGGKADALSFDPFASYTDQLSPETSDWLQNKLMGLIDTLDQASTRCEGFLRQLTRIAEH